MATVRSAANKSKKESRKQEQKRNSLRNFLGLKKNTQVAPFISGTTAKGVKRRRRKSTKKRKPRKKKSVKKRKGKSKKKRVRRGRKTRRKVRGGGGVPCMFFFKTPSIPKFPPPPDHIKMTFQRVRNEQTVTGFSVLYFNNDSTNTEFILEAKPTRRLFGKISDLDFNVKHGGNIIGEFKKKNANDKHGSLTITGRIKVDKVNLLLKNKDGEWEGYDPALLPRHMEPDTFTNPKTEEEILIKMRAFSSPPDPAPPAATTITGPGASAADAWGAAAAAPRSGSEATHKG